jgi:hypothetical protein
MTHSVCIFSFFSSSLLQNFDSLCNEIDVLVLHDLIWSLILSELQAAALPGSNGSLAVEHTLKVQYTIFQSVLFFCSSDSDSSLQLETCLRMRMQE